MNKFKKYPIKVVSKKTGLSMHVIRAWEKRYHVVKPERTDTNRRLYSEDDVYRLGLLKRATNAGYHIGDIAELPISNLEALVGDRLTSPELDSENQTKSQTNSDPAHHYAHCMEAIYSFDHIQFESALLQASLALTQPVLVESVIIPVVEQVGELWRKGSLRIMHEHMVMVVLKTFLTNLRNSNRPNSNAPRVIVTTPVGQIHEMGALIIALIAATEGWQVVYLGTNLPAEEIATAAIQKRAKAVILSIVYPADDPFLFQELEKLRNLLPIHIKILIGGRGAGNYQQVLTKIAAWTSSDLSEFRNYLELIEKSD